MKKLLLFFIFSSKLMQGQEIKVDFLNSMDANIYTIKTSLNNSFTLLL